MTNLVPRTDAESERPPAAPGRLAAPPERVGAAPEQGRTEPERVAAAPARPAAGPVSGARSARKHRDMLAAATTVFLQHGYLGANMDEIAALSGVSKQTVYKHFASKEALFVAIVSGLTTAAGDTVHLPPPDGVERAGLAAYLTDYATRQITVVLTPQLMQLRRLVIGEVARFPDLARVLYEDGPQRALTALAALFARLAERGLLVVPEPRVAAAHFNWLVMGEAINRAMLLGDEAIPPPEELRRQAAAGVQVFLAAYGRD